MSLKSKIYVAWNLWQEGVKPTRIAERIGVHRATVYRWIRRFKYCGLRRTIKAYENAKKGRRRKRVTVETKIKIYEIRKKYANCCGKKIKYYLEKEEVIKVSVSTIYRVLRKKYKLSGRYKKRKYGEAPKGKVEREVIQADTVDFGEIYAYTYIDTYTRQAVVDLELGLESEDGYASLTVAGKKFGRMELIQSDGGSEYEGEFRKHVLEYADKHRVSRPYKKNEQSFIESFNRTLRKECLGWRKYSWKELRVMKEKVREYMDFYNNRRPHLGLDMKIPNEVAVCRI